MTKKANNPENLIPLSQRTPEERRRIGSMGGKASQEAQRKRKTFKTLMNDFADGKISNEKMIKRMKAFGIDDEDLTNKMALAFALYTEALKGNVSAFKEFRDVIGEGKQVEDDKEISKVEELLNKIKQEANDDING